MTFNPTRNPEAVNSHYDIANTHSNAGRFAEAEREYRLVIARDPGHAEAHYRLGLSLQDQRRFAEAAASYRNALSLHKGHARAHNNLGAVLQMQELLPEAMVCFKNAVDLAPKFDEPYLNLGRLQAGAGDLMSAAQTYKRAIELCIEPEMFRHLLDALEGVKSDRAPVEFTRTAYDHFADSFDERVLVGLDYRIPKILGDRINEKLQSQELRVLDLGCGTGLCASHINARHIIGVDVSAGMLAKARQRGLYDELVECDIVEYVAKAPSGCFDAVLAADVFICLGDLSEIFREVARVMSAGGMFGLSIETTSAPGPDYLLQSNGHFAQSHSYISRIAGENGLDIAESFPEQIRSGHGHNAPGHVFILQKS